jgi:hypothetical protein
MSMPVISHTEYSHTVYLFNGFWQTVIPGLMQLYPRPSYTRERLELDDGDFLDLDWLDTGSDELILITHGLEGNSYSFYVRALVKAFGEAGLSCLAWNCRSCSEELNRTKKLYHHGEIKDFEYVLQHASNRFRKIALIGVSMGGNIIFKWLGLSNSDLQERVNCAVSISAPCDLAGASETLDHFKNILFRIYFEKSLKAKLRAKNKQFPGLVDLNVFKRYRKWRELDDAISAPLFGFKNADEFYKQGSSINYMPGITKPSLLLNAANDPVLSESCYPSEIASKNKYIHLEIPKMGGHATFPSGISMSNYSARRALKFVNHFLK